MSLLVNFYLAVALILLEDLEKKLQLTDGLIEVDQFVLEVNFDQQDCTDEALDNSAQ